MIDDFFSRVLFELALKATIWLIGKCFSAEYADEVIHSLLERLNSRGALNALRSSIKSLLHLGTAPFASRLPHAMFGTAAYLATIQLVVLTGNVLAVYLGVLLPHVAPGLVSQIGAFCESLLSLNLAWLMSSFAQRFVVHLQLRRQYFLARLFGAIGVAFFCWYLLNPSIMATSEPISFGSIAWRIVVITLILGTGAIMVWQFIERKIPQQYAVLADRVFRQIE